MRKRKKKILEAGGGGEAAAVDGEPEETGVEPASGNELMEETRHEAAPAPEKPVRNFFDLAPEEIAAHKPAQPGAIIAAAAPRKRKYGKLLRAGGACIAAAGIVTLLVLFWPAPGAKVPDLVGKMLGEAMRKAGAAGFETRVDAWEYSDTHSDGVILSQEPKGGKTSARGIEVSLVVSKGPKPESVEPPAPASSPQPSDGNLPGPLSGKIVCIDPGHQVPTGQDEWVDPGMTKRNPPQPGERGAATGNAEHLLSLDVSLKLKSLLEKDGIEVVITRESGDVDVTDVTRAEMANAAAADLLVSVHFNFSEDPEKKGTSTLYPARNKWTDPIYEKSKTAALFIEEETAKSCTTEDLGIFPMTEMTLFNWSRVPVVETLPVFISNPEEDSELAKDDFRWKVAWGIRNGIIEYFNRP